MTLFLYLRIEKVHRKTMSGMLRTKGFRKNARKYGVSIKFIKYDIYLHCWNNSSILAYLQT